MAGLCIRVVTLSGLPRGPYLINTLINRLVHRLRTNDHPGTA